MAACSSPEVAGLTPFCGVSDNFVAVVMDAPSLFDDGSVPGWSVE